MDGNAGASKNTACLSTSTFNYVKDSCHGTQSCEMTASNSNFGETCAERGERRLLDGSSTSEGEEEGESESEDESSSEEEEKED